MPAAAQTDSARTGAVTEACRLLTAQRPDTAVFTLYLSPPFGLADTSSRARTYIPFLQRVAGAFLPPASVTMETWPGTSFESEEEPTISGEGIIRGIGALTGQVQFKLAKGRVRKLAWELLPDSREVTRAIQEAIHRADSLQHFVGLKAPPGGLVRLFVTMPREEPAPGSAPLVRIRMPYLRADSPVTPLHMPRPEFPANAARRQVEGDVTLQYLVDEHGRAQRASIRVISANYQDFVDAATEAVSAATYRPAQARGCPVKLMVQQRIRFLRH